MEAEEAARQCTALAMILKSRAHTAARKLRRRGCCESASSTALHDAQMTVRTGQLLNLLIRGGKGVTPWLAMLRGHLPTTTDTDQLTRL